MKMLVLVVFAWAALPIAGAQSGQGSLQARFAELEAHAPKGFPTLFVVGGSDRQPGQVLGPPGECDMSLETLGKIYSVYAKDTFHECISLQPGTIVWGRDHRILGEVLDILDTTGSKPKSRRYFVQNITLVDPNKQ